MTCQGLGRLPEPVLGCCPVATGVAVPHHQAAAAAIPRQNQGWVSRLAPAQGCLQVTLAARCPSQGWAAGLAPWLLAWAQQRVPEQVRVQELRCWLCCRLRGQRQVHID